MAKNVRKTVGMHNNQHKNRPDTQPSYSYHSKSSSKSQSTLSASIKRVKLKNDRSQPAMDNQTTIAESNPAVNIPTLKSLLTCTICFEVQTRIKTCSNGHLICDECSQGLFRQNGTVAKCPICRVGLRGKLSRCLIAEQLASELPITCSQCQESVARRLFNEHESTSCPKRPADCRFRLIGCDWRGFADNKERHDASCPTGSKSIRACESALVERLLESRSVWTHRSQLLDRLVQRITQCNCPLFHKQVELCSKHSRDKDLLIYGNRSPIQFKPTVNVDIEAAIDCKLQRIIYRLKLNLSSTECHLEFCLRSVKCGKYNFALDDKLHLVGRNRWSETCDSQMFSSNQPNTSRFATFDNLSALYRGDCESPFANLFTKNNHDTNRILLDFIIMDS